MHFAVNGGTDHLDSTESSMTEVEEEDVGMEAPPPLTAPTLVLEQLVPMILASSHYLTFHIDCH